MITQENFADKLTSMAMTEIFGKRFTETEDITEDYEMSREWDRLNDEFYHMIQPYYPTKNDFTFEDYIDLVECANGIVVEESEKEQYMQWYNETWDEYYRFVKENGYVNIDEYFESDSLSGD